jgi:hypothetical protein
MSQAYEQLMALGGEFGMYTPAGKAGRRVLALIEPVRRTDALGNQSFLTKTYELLIVKSATEGVTQVKAGFDTFAVKLLPDDAEPTTLRITKVSPERDDGVPGDGIGMWHLEAVV